MAEIVNKKISEALDTFSKILITEAYTNTLVCYTDDWKSVAKDLTIVEIRFRIGEMPEIFLETKNSLKFTKTL